MDACHRPRMRAEHFRVFAIAMVAVLGLGGCAKSRGPKDIKIARAQYDLARDAFANARYRQALDFVGRALEKDDQNPTIMDLLCTFSLCFGSDCTHTIIHGKAVVFHIVYYIVKCIGNERGTVRRYNMYK